MKLKYDTGIAWRLKCTTLLIEPYGIEMRMDGQPPRHKRHLLIEPYGIEIIP